MRSATRFLRAPLWLAALLLAALAAPVSATPPGDDIEVEGPITALGASSLTVAGLTFAVTPATEIEDDDGNPIPFSALTLGLYVEVEGYYDASGTLIATEIEVEDDDGEVEAEGRVVARTDTSVAVGGLTFVVTAATRVLDDDDRPIPYSAIVVGVRVEVTGRLLADGRLVATEIELDDEDDGDLEVEGLITALSPEALTVAGTTFALTATTTYVGDDGQPASFDDLAVGVRVEVHGQYGADGSLTATRVELDDFGDDELEITGAIEALTDASLTVAARTFAVTPQTVVLDRNRLPIPFASLTVGQVVEVKAVVGAAGTLTATRIKLEDGLPGVPVLDEVEARAALTAVTDSVAVVLGRPFVVTPATRIRSASGAPATLASLPLNALVEVRARREADGRLVALTLDAEDGPAASVRLRAAVTAVTADSLEVLGVAFDATAATVTGLDGLPATLADVLPGQVVLVHGTATDVGYTAATVAILRAAGAAGRVAAPSASGFVLPGVTVATGPGTLYVTEAGAVVVPSALVAGTAVRASGTLAADGTLVASQVTVLAMGNPVAGEGAPAASVALALFPNPAHGAATLRLALAAAAEVRVEVLDALGRTVLRADARASAGASDVRLDTERLPSGVYLVRATADGRVLGTQRLTVVR